VVEDEADPRAWIILVGNPMRREVEGLKRAMWWAAGSAMGAGVVLGLVAPYILKKLGLG
jgi:hypothetical protein